MNNVLLGTLRGKDVPIDESSYSHLRACRNPISTQSPYPVNQHFGAALQDENTFQIHVDSKDLTRLVGNPSMNAHPHTGTGEGLNGLVNNMFDFEYGNEMATSPDWRELNLSPGLTDVVPEIFPDTMGLGDPNITIPGVQEPDLSLDSSARGSNIHHSVVRDSEDRTRSTTDDSGISHSPSGYPGILAFESKQRSFAVLSDTTVENQRSSPPSPREWSTHVGRDIPSLHCFGRSAHAPTQLSGYSSSDLDHVGQSSDKIPSQYKDSTAISGSTPLHYAVANKHLSTVRELILHGADVSAPDKEGYTALHICAKNQLRDDLRIVQLLVEAGAPLEFRDWRDLTPLQAAAERGNDQIVKLLLALGADVNSRSASDREE